MGVIAYGPKNHKVLHKTGRHVQEETQMIPLKKGPPEIDFILPSSSITLESMCALWESSCPHSTPVHLVSRFQSYSLMWMMAKMLTPSNSQCSTGRFVKFVQGQQLRTAEIDAELTKCASLFPSFVLMLTFTHLQLLSPLFMHHQSPELWRKHPPGFCNATLDFLMTKHPKLTSTLPLRQLR